MEARLVLWDIDGTLLRTGDLGALVFDRALEGVLGQQPAARITMSGKTDPQIVGEYLALMEVDDPTTLPAILERLELELAAIEHELAATGAPCPGITQLLARLDAMPWVAQSVLTGNIAPNALVKLRAVGLHHWLDLEAGAYGSDHRDRRELVPVALDRQRSLRGRVVAPEDVWVVGDTPNDLACARAGGAHCLLVGTGRYAAEELAALGPDAVVADCTDTEALAAVLGGT